MRAQPIFLLHPAASIDAPAARRDFGGLRREVALARALLDEVERLAPAGCEAAIDAQTIEELTRVGCRLIETAAALAEGSEARGPGLARAAEGRQIDLDFELCVTALR